VARFQTVPLIFQDDRQRIAIVETKDLVITESGDYTYTAIIDNTTDWVSGSRFRFNKQGVIQSKARGTSSFDMPYHLGGTFKQEFIWKGKSN